MKKLNAKNFAQIFVRTRNAGETARRLGAEPEESVRLGEQMLSDRRVKAEISKLDREDGQTLCYVKTGLSRLAFGSVNDAVSLIFDDCVTQEKIMKADLFNVSEIKRVKGGGVEMKFWDRQKALEKLVELAPELKEVSDADRFLQAVYGGSADMSEYEEEEEDA